LGTPRLGILVAMAMFVFVIDTSLMNVSISAVVPLALQVSLLVPLLTSLLGLFFAFRMMRLPDPAPSNGAEAAALG
jgi:hypothetical protein